MGHPVDLDYNIQGKQILRFLSSKLYFVSVNTLNRKAVAFPHVFKIQNIYTTMIISYHLRLRRTDGLADEQVQPLSLPLQRHRLHGHFRGGLQVDISTYLDI